MPHGAETHKPERLSRAGLSCDVRVGPISRHPAGSDRLCRGERSYARSGLTQHQHRVE